MSTQTTAMSVAIASALILSLSTPSLAHVYEDKTSDPPDRFQARIVTKVIHTTHKTHYVYPRHGARIIYSPKARHPHARYIHAQRVYKNRRVSEHYEDTEHQIEHPHKEKQLTQPHVYNPQPKKHWRHHRRGGHRSWHRPRYGFGFYKHGHHHRVIRHQYPLKRHGHHRRGGHHNHCGHGGITIHLRF